VPASSATAIVTITGSVIIPMKLLGKPSGVADQWFATAEQLIAAFKSQFSTACEFLASVSASIDSTNEANKPKPLPSSSANAASCRRFESLFESHLRSISNIKTHLTNRR